jgi:hypothetical protein
MTWASHNYDVCGARGLYLSSSFWNGQTINFTTEPASRFITYHGFVDIITSGGRRTGAEGLQYACATPTYITQHDPATGTGSVTSYQNNGGFTCGVGGARAAVAE